MGGSTEAKLDDIQGEKIRLESGFGNDQISWVEQSSKLIDEMLEYSVSKFMGFHVPSVEFSTAAYEADYQTASEPKTEKATSSARRLRRKTEILA